MVRVLDNLSSGSLGNLHAAAERQSRAGGKNGSRLEVIIGDVRDRELLRKALRGVKYMFHLAGLPPSAGSISGPDEVHAVNAEGTLNVLQGALTEGVWRVVLGSCASVYGTPTTLPVPEDAPVGPTSLFAASKVAAEIYCRAFHARHRLDTVTLRYFSVYGPRQNPVRPGPLVPNLIEAVLQRRPLADLDDQSAEDFIYVDDAVAATLAAARAPRAGGCVINVGSGQLVTIGEALNIIADLMRMPVVSGKLRNPDAQPHRICAQMALAGQLLDFTPRVPLIAGLARVIRSRAEAEQLERPALAKVGLDD